MLFEPHQNPRSVFAGELARNLVGSVVTCKAILKIISVADVKASCGILSNVHPEHVKLAPAVGFEPTTNRLTADRSTTELRWNLLSLRLSGVYIAQTSSHHKYQSINPDRSGLYH